MRFSFGIVNKREKKEKTDTARANYLAHSDKEQRRKKIAFIL